MPLYGKRVTVRGKSQVISSTRKLHSKGYKLICVERSSYIGYAEKERVTYYSLKMSGCLKPQHVNSDCHFSQGDLTEITITPERSGELPESQISRLLVKQGVRMNRGRLLTSLTPYTHEGRSKSAKSKVFPLLFQNNLDIMWGTNGRIIVR